MAKRKGGGGNRSAAAKKGWETRRRNAGAGGKGKSKATAPSKASSGKGGKPAKSTLWNGREGQAVRTANRVAAKVIATAGGKDRSARAQVSAATARRAADYLTAKAKTGKEPAKRRGGLTSNANLVAMRAAQGRMARKANPAKPAKTSKAPANAAKSKYKAAKSQARELRMYRGGKSDAVVKKAEAKVKRMERTRRASRARV